MAFSLLSQEKQEQIYQLQSMGNDNSIEKIKNDYFKGNEQKREQRDKLYEGFENFKRQLDIFSPCRFEISFLKANPDLAIPFAYAILHPEVWEPPELSAMLSGKQCYEFSWYLSENISISEYRKICNDLTTQDLWDQQLHLAITYIKAILNNPMPIISKRRRFIAEIIENFESANYEIAFVAVFVAIEGLLWDFGEQINNSIGGVYDRRKRMINMNTNKPFESTRVRDLMKKTALKGYLNPEFIKHFCSELYDDRNLVVHGRGNCSDCSQLRMGLIYKILTLNYIFSKLDSLCSKEMLSSLDKIISPERVIQLLSELY